MNETESCNSDFRARELLEGADEQKRHELMQARGQLVPTEKIGISLPFDFKDSLFCIFVVSFGGCSCNL